ncbi:hypothetical protein PACTADRAFT_81 [Pachysolen tannophilus NRRL Y-2460]|uniref:Uncharacterized protein n=1 Tax=Pachysolen tannophilus NRRL Y-2460 TaxID=669874 RepID=A0A1E4U0P8_PACTA|nr:hypothetical protein PACTADRAFT_81 [Pachysolen tannophilus NRRL Y-2460]
MGKNSKKSLTGTPKSGKNIEAITPKNVKYSQKKYPSKYASARKTTTTHGGKGEIIPRNKNGRNGIGKSGFDRRFSLVSDSSLSDVSDDEVSAEEDARNFHSMPVFDSSSEDDDDGIEGNAEQSNDDHGNNHDSSDDDDDDDDDNESSDYDSDVDFVKLTAERKAKAMKMAGRKSNRNLSLNNGQGKEGEIAVDFQFDFDNDGNETLTLSKAYDSPPRAVAEEDLGEEVVVPQNSSNVDKNNDISSVSLSNVAASGNNPFVLIDNDYDANILSDSKDLLTKHLLIDVPKINDDEINSDQDYEIDDDKLIQTLQNDNDDLELSALNSDEDEILNSNEFDNLSFEGEEEYEDSVPEDIGGNDYDEEDDENEDEEDSYLLKEETDALVQEFGNNDMENNFDDDPLSYFSSNEASFVFSDEEEDEEDDENNDNDHDNEAKSKEDKNRSKKSLGGRKLSFFEDPFADAKFYSHQQGRRHNSTIPSNSAAISADSDDEEDDSYLIRYFFKNNRYGNSSDDYDDDSSSDVSDSDDHEDNEEASKRISSKGNPNNGLKMVQEQDQQQVLHSGYSTDEDKSMPPPSTLVKKIGIKNAKEVLSSSASDARPPFLGKWIPEETDKPYSIIDGLSTKSLISDDFEEEELQRNMKHRFRNSPLSMATSSVKVQPEPMAIDDLLNMSELEESDIDDIDDNDNSGTKSNDPGAHNDKNDKTWGGYIMNNPRRVPLSAFRNKGYINHDSNIYQMRRYSASNNFNGPSTTSSSSAIASTVLHSSANKRRSSVVNHRRPSISSKADDFKINPKFTLANRNSTVKSGKKKLSKKERFKKREKKAAKVKRASVIEATAEGLRTTKSGLFSENTIADVEAFLADVDTGDEFSILFRGII